MSRIFKHGLSRPHLFTWALGNIPLNNCSLMGHFQSTQILEQWPGRAPAGWGFQKRPLPGQNSNRRRAFYIFCYPYLPLEMLNRKKVNGWKPNIQQGMNVSLKSSLFFRGLGGGTLWKLKIHSHVCFFKIINDTGLITYEEIKMIPGDQYFGGHWYRKG